MDDVWEIPPAALEALPVFPLTNVVLLPGMVLPLNVFEPRYVALADAVEAGDGFLGIPLVSDPSRAMEDAPDLEPVFGVGRVTLHRRLPDGRRFLRVHGVRRVAVRFEHPRRTPYRTFAVDLLPEPPLREPTLAEILVTQLERIAVTLQACERDIVQAVAQIPDPRMLAYAVTAILPALGLSAPEVDDAAVAVSYGPHLRAQQRALAAEDTDARFRILIEHTGVITGVLGDSGRFPRVMFN